LVGENPDFDYQKDGDASGSEKDAEGTKEVKPEIGGEVGDGKEVTGKENSAESKADDVKDEEEAIGFNDKQQTSLEAADEGPLKDDDQAEREGEVDDPVVETEAAAIDRILNLINEAEDDEPVIPEEPIAEPKEDVDEKCCKEESEIEVPESDHDDAVEDTDYSEGEGDAPAGVDEAMDNIDYYLDALEEAEALEEIEVKADNITEEDDAAEREGEVKHDDKNVEGVKQEVPAAAVEGDVKKDPIEDTCDCGEREGTIKHDEKNIEGVKTPAVPVTLEASDDFVDSLLDDLDSDDDLIDLVDAELVVDDSVKTDGETNNDIKVDEAAKVDKKAEELIDDPDDEDIEAIDSNDVPADADDYEYELDDDELIDAVDQGIDVLL
jgi:hypothetical protein